jgi:hypothetical protein
VLARVLEPVLARDGRHLRRQTLAAPPPPPVMTRLRHTSKLKQDNTGKSTVTGDRAQEAPPHLQDLAEHHVLEAGDGAGVGLAVVALEGLQEVRVARLVVPLLAVQHARRLVQLRLPAAPTRLKLWPA